MNTYEALRAPQILKIRSFRPVKIASLHIRYKGGNDAPLGLNAGLKMVTLAGNRIHTLRSLEHTA